MGGRGNNPGCLTEPGSPPTSAARPPLQSLSVVFPVPPCPSFLFSNPSLDPSRFLCSTFIPSLPSPSLGNLSPYNTTFIPSQLPGALHSFTLNPSTPRRCTSSLSSPACYPLAYKYLQVSQVTWFAVANLNSMFAYFYSTYYPDDPPPAQATSSQVVGRALGKQRGQPVLVGPRRTTLVQSSVS
ncbi:hypothetical protein E2C01_091926 [Portunus trituberculatus]|uniref:Uncharacterized protein n=1 Tax=Portunus trituberculatus TaxID=210409 RepID=A0A5B7JQ02_PORTR|nr:hypothetical protein [Portunus trituberculatus]